MFCALVSVCISSRRKVHMQSIVTLFELLRTYGEGFSEERWRDIMTKVIKPLFDEIKLNFQNKKGLRDDDWLVYNEASREAFMRMTDIYNLYFSKMQNLLNLFLQVLASCIQSTNEQLAQITINAFKYTINRCNSHFGEKQWGIIVNAFEEICKTTIPVQLIDFPLTEPFPTGSDNSLVQSVVQLMMITLIRDMIEIYGYRFSTQVFLSFFVSV